jgi:hypothetical protein
MRKVIVDEAGSYNETAGFDHPPALLPVYPPNLGDLALADPDVRHVPRRARAVHNPAVFQYDIERVRRL